MMQGPPGIGCRPVALLSRAYNNALSAEIFDRVRSTGAGDEGEPRQRDGAIDYGRTAAADRHAQRFGITAQSVGAPVDELEDRSWLRRTQGRIQATAAPS